MLNNTIKSVDNSNNKKNNADFDVGVDDDFEIGVDDDFDYNIK